MLGDFAVHTLVLASAPAAKLTRATQGLVESGAKLIYYALHFHLLDFATALLHCFPYAAAAG